MASADLDDEHDDREDDFDDRSRPLHDRSNAIVLYPREPFFTWVRQLPDYTPANEKMLERRPTVYLIPELDRPERAATWLRVHYPHLFEHELEVWCADEAYWPAERSFELFTAWFDTAFCDDVMDCAHIDAAPVDCPPVSPEQLVDAIAALPAGAEPFLDLRTGTLVALGREMLAALAGGQEPDPVRPEEWRAAVVRVREGIDEETMVSLREPLLYEEVTVREAFADSVPVPPSVRNRLVDSLHGKKAARRFLETVDRCGLRSRWQEFQRDVTIEAMREWLRVMRVPTTADD